MPALWWVEMGHGSLADSDMSRGVSVGGCGLRKSLGSLSAHAHLLFGLRCFQHWILQTAGWGQVLVPKYQPLGELTQMNIP